MNQKEQFAKERDAAVSIAVMNKDSEVASAVLLKEKDFMRECEKLKTQMEAERDKQIDIVITKLAAEKVPISLTMPSTRRSSMVAPIVDEKTLQEARESAKVGMERVIALQSLLEDRDNEIRSLEGDLLLSNSKIEELKTESETRQSALEQANRELEQLRIGEEKIAERVGEYSQTNVEASA